jgi:rhamnosyl/mannosyltransferase
VKVLHVCKGYYPELVGGMEQVVRGIADGTAALGTDAEVICTSDLGDTRTEKIGRCLIHFNRTNFQLGVTPISFALWRQFRGLIEEADLIHYHFPYPYVDLIHFITGVNRPSVVTYHSDIVRQKWLLHIYRPLMRRFLSSVDSIVATSPDYLLTSEVLPDFREKTRVIPIGVDRALYPLVQGKKLEYWRNRVGRKFFLFVGVLRYYKGLFVLLRAAKRSGYPVVVVGTGPLEKKLKNVVARQGIMNVEFTGRLSEEDKVALLMLCYSVVLPSNLRAEAFGVSLLEGGMFGKPLISCEIKTGTSFINIDKCTGIVVQPGDPVALRSAMEFLWDHPEEAAIMGERAKARYFENFTAQKMAQSYIELYNRITRGD